MYDDNSDAKYKTVLATSSGEPPRFNAISLVLSARVSGGKVSVISVSIKPGQMEFTVIPDLAVYQASDLVKPRIPALEELQIA